MSSPNLSGVVVKRDLSLAEKITGINKAINLMSERGNSVRFDNYSPTQLFEIQRFFPDTEIKVRPLGSNSNRYYLTLEVEHVTIFSKTLTDED